MKVITNKNENEYKIFLNKDEYNLLLKLIYHSFYRPECDDKDNI